jgi:hypothetical protein
MSNENQFKGDSTDMSHMNWRIMQVQRWKKPLLVMMATGLAAFIGTTTRAAQMTHGKHDGYVQTNLVWDGIAGPKANMKDANLKNPWGIAFFPGSPFWIADNAIGLATLYDGAGNVNPRWCRFRLRGVGPVRRRPVSWPI